MNALRTIVINRHNNTIRFSRRANSHTFALTARREHAARQALNCNMFARELSLTKDQATKSAFMILTARELASDEAN